MVFPEMVLRPSILKLASGSLKIPIWYPSRNMQHEWVPGTRVCTAEPKKWLGLGLVSF